jgi:stearoyl-CoA desaturase (delta-9 desaturase)
MLLIDLYFFGAWGFLVWGIQMLWIPFWAAGVVNGLGHWFGYRNTNTKDKSTNLIPWGIIIGGEELHNNHHKNPASAKLSEKWWEVDIGWLYVRILSFFKMIQVRQTV